MTPLLSFDHPWALALLLLALLAVPLGRRRLGARWRVATVLRAATLALLALALAGPLVRVHVPGINVVFAVDRSLSIGPEGQRAEEQFLQAAFARMHPRDRAGVVTFAGRPRLVVPVEPHPALEDLGPAAAPDATDIGSAVDLAARMLPADGARRVVVLSDGAENRGDALGEARLVRQTGVTVDVVPILPGRADDVLVDSLVAPQTARPGEVYEVRAVLRATAPADATVTLWRDGAVVATRRITLAAGTTAVPFAETAGAPGTHRYRVDVDAEPAAARDNKRGEALVVVRDTPRVLFVAGGAPVLPQWLRGQGLQVDVRGPDQLPDHPAGFGGYGSIVLDDVSALDLTRAQQESIRDFVGVQGGGLVAIGGPHSFGLGGYAGTPLEDALPVAMDVRQTMVLPTVAIVLVIDTSGSMDAFGSELAKEELAKEIASSVIDLLGEHDQIGVITFDQDYRWLVPPTEARQRAKVLDQISRLKAGGGTLMYPPLRGAWDFLRRSPAKVRHVIVLSDGLTDPGDFRGIAALMTRDRITLSTVAIGGDADLEFMRKLARWTGGRAYAAKDLYAVPKIFTAEALMAVRSFVVEERVPLARRGEAPTLAGLPVPPPIRGYVATVPKPPADIGLTGPRGDPVLASWQYGIGRSVAVTSDDGARWTAPWGSWPDAARFWSQAVRWTLGSDVPGLDLTASVNEDGNSGTVTLDAERAGGLPFDGLDVRAQVTGPDGGRRSVDLVQDAPGRYAGTWRIAGTGTYSLTAMASDGARVIGTRTVGVVVPYSPEYRTPGGNPTLLSRMAETTGGAVLRAADDAFRPGPGTGRREAWPPLAAAAVGLLVVEVAARRIAAVGETLAAWAGVVRGWKRRPAEEDAARRESDHAYDAADRWAVEEARFQQEEALRSSSMTQAGRLYIARLRGGKRS